MSCYGSTARAGRPFTTGERSGMVFLLIAMALGMCTRNIAAVFAAFFGITDPPQGLFVMVVLVVPLAAIVAVVAARLFARHAPKVKQI